MSEFYEVQGLCVDVKYLVLGMLSNNVYVISDGKGTMVVDPSCKADVILEALGDTKVDAILLTHYHFDHTSAAAELRAATGAPVIASAGDAPFVETPPESSFHRRYHPCKVDRTVSHGDVVEVGDMRWKVMETPGHSPGSVCYFMIPPFGNHPDGLPVLISGDTLFAGTTGRTDFEDGSPADMTASIKKLAFLPDDTVVLPGHNALTQIGGERERVFALFGDEDEEDE